MVVEKARPLLKRAGKEKPSKKLLVVSEKSEFIGGLEKYVYQSSKILVEAGFQLQAFFAQKVFHLRIHATDEYTHLFSSVCWGYSIEALKKAKKAGFKIVLVHSCSSQSFVEYVLKNFLTIFFVHDHRYYCKRGQKYFPVINANCRLPYHNLYCSVCGYFSRNSKSHVFMLPCLKSSHAIIVLSNHMKAHLKQNEIEEKKIHVVPPYVAENLEKDGTEMPMYPVFSSSKALRICYVGQLVRGKGVDILFKAVSNLFKKNYNFTLHLVGEGCQHAELIIMAEQMEILDNTVFYGKHDNPTSIVASSDIVVVPSRWQEPFALVGVEAMLQEKPVIAFKQGGMGEWLEDEKTGFFAKAGSVKSLQKKIAVLLEDSILRKKMGILGKVEAKRKFGKETFKKNICSLIAEVQT